MDSKQASQFTTGLLIVAMGLIMLFSQLDSGWGWSWNFSRLWPVIFVVLAIGQFVNRDRENWGGAVWFLFLGGIFLMHTFRVLALSHSWPLFIVAGGLSMIFHRGRRAGRNKVQE